MRLILFISLAALSACKGKAPSGRKNPYVAPALNQPRTVTLERRNRVGPDNYAATCLFLNDSFRRLNTCSLSVQTDLSIVGAQAGGQIAQFSQGGAGDVGRGERIEARDLKVGDVWVLRKAHPDVQYELAFEIERVDADAVTINYEVNSFRHLN